MEEEYKPDPPSKRVTDHCEFILSNVDSDIANEYRRYGHGVYNPDSPLFVQISRCLRGLVAILSKDSI